MHPLIGVIAYLLLPLLTFCLFPEATASVAALIITAVLLGLFHATVKRFVIELMQPAVKLRTAPAAVERRAEGVATYLAGLRVKAGMADEAVILARFFAFLIFLLGTLGLIVTEAFLFLETMRGMYTYEVGNFSRPYLDKIESYLPEIMTGTCVMGPILAGILIFDCKLFSNLTPLHDYEEAQRRSIEKWAWGALGLFALVLVLMAVYRGLSAMPVENIGMLLEPSTMLDLDLTEAEMLAVDSYQQGPDSEREVQLGRVGTLINLSLALAAGLLLFSLKWIVGSIGVFSAILIAKTTEIALWVLGFALRCLQLVTDTLFGTLAIVLDLLLRLFALAATPIRPYVDQNYIDAEPPSALFATPQSETPQTAAPEPDNTNQGEEQPPEKQHDELEEVMTVTDDPDPQPNHNWDPYR